MAEITEFKPRNLVPKKRVADQIGTTGSGGPDDPDMERLARLENEFEHISKDIDEVKADQKSIIGQLNTISNSLAVISADLRTKPSAAQFWVMIFSVAVIALAVIAAIVGGMGYLAGLQQPGQAQMPAPQIIVVPTMPSLGVPEQQQQAPPPSPSDG